MAVEHRQGNRICLGAGARIVGMQMVSAVVTREQLRGVARIENSRTSRFFREVLSQQPVSVFGQLN